ncbi:hypothetical protein AURDEDRAFT_168718 [Auricularia subglabra TFB-10046 SS5]|nr:hypothetical protein AURDEDRAFT_168718 [Auricularia subglabra TFB-10046 SS5]
MSSRANELVKALMREMKRAGRFTSEVLEGSTAGAPGSELAADPFATMPFHEFVKERETSQVYSVINCMYEWPAWSPRTGCLMVPGLQAKKQWDMLEYFSFLKGKMLMDDMLDTQADYLRAILSFIRDTELLPDEYTSEFAVGRLLGALSYKRVFRGRMYTMRTGNVDAHGEALREVMAYICDNLGVLHDSCPAEPRQRRRIIVPDDVPLPPRSPSPASDDAQGPPEPPLYRARHHRATIEERGAVAWEAVTFAVLRETTRLEDAPDPLDHHVGVIQLLLARIRTKEFVPTPYFEGPSDADLRAAFERDPTFTAELEELKRAADRPGGGKSFDACVRRLVNHPPQTDSGNDQGCAIRTVLGWLLPGM